MAHYEDLSICDYYSHAFYHFFKKVPQLIAIGWLEREFSYNQGKLDFSVYDKLKRLDEDSEWQPMSSCGFHRCRLCQYDGPMFKKNLYIPGENVIYMMPIAILHYVSCHSYLPPFEFCDAVMKCPPVGSEEYFLALQLKGFPLLIGNINHTKKEEFMNDLKGYTLEFIIKLFNTINKRLPSDFQELNSFIINLNNYFDNCFDYSLEKDDTEYRCRFNDGQNLCGNKDEVISIEETCSIFFKGFGI